MKNNNNIAAKFNSDNILIIDFGSQYTQLIARRVREEGVFCQIVPYNKVSEYKNSEDNYIHYIYKHI